jgi:hypothetical protein
MGKKLSRLPRLSSVFSFFFIAFVFFKAVQNPSLKETTDETKRY